MNVSFKKSLLVAALSTGMLAASAATADIEANIGVTSNYMWRGMTQTQDQAAISGGLDYSAGGFYAGTWASNVDWGNGAKGYELDLYAGYGGEAGPVGYDLGYIAYMYPVEAMDGSDFSEVYVNLSYSVLSAGVAVTVDSDWEDDDDTYAYIGAEFGLSDDYSLGLTYGAYSDSDTYGDQDHFDVSLAKGDFSFLITSPSDDNTDGDPRVAVSWGTTF